MSVIVMFIIIENNNKIKINENYTRTHHIIYERFDVKNNVILDDYINGYILGYNLNNKNNEKIVNYYINEYNEKYNKKGGDDY